MTPKCPRRPCFGASYGYAPGSAQRLRPREDAGRVARNVWLVWIRGLKREEHGPKGIVAGRDVVGPYAGLPGGGSSLADFHSKGGAPCTQGRLGKLETFQHLGRHVRVDHAAGEHSFHAWQRGGKS